MKPGRLQILENLGFEWAKETAELIKDIEQALEACKIYSSAAMRHKESWYQIEEEVTLALDRLKKWK